jgi:hypothetical protein
MENILIEEFVGWGIDLGIPAYFPVSRLPEMMSIFFTLGLCCEYKT